MTRHWLKLLRLSSTMTSKTGCSDRSRFTLTIAALSFDWGPLRASTSLRITLWIPPSKPTSFGLFTSCRRSPCADATKRTPRFLQDLVASTSCLRPISSSTMAWGVWFCTHSTITEACALGVGTMRRLACPTQGWGRSPSPAISLDVSMITTLFLSARTRVTSRMAVVLPLPGSPRNRMEGGIVSLLLGWFRSRSAIMAALPETCRPTRKVRPMM
mmetsp:Transcript_4481/g.11779  ORF Transcript_4481/g.11779 Transcript_4481/m.11779 type:complete len:215 (-) Transcript_4481:8-652(-)